MLGCMSGVIFTARILASGLTSWMVSRTVWLMSVGVRWMAAFRLNRRILLMMSAARTASAWASFIASTISGSAGDSSTRSNRRTDPEM